MFASYYNRSKHRGRPAAAGQEKVTGGKESKMGIRDKIDVNTASDQEIADWIERQVKREGEAFRAQLHRDVLELDTLWKNGGVERPLESLVRETIAGYMDFYDKVDKGYFPGLENQLPKKVENKTNDKTVLIVQVLFVLVILLLWFFWR